MSPDAAAFPDSPLQADNLARVQDIDNLTGRPRLELRLRYFVLFQVLSRSGATIGRLALAARVAVAAEFTFFLAIPIMAGACVETSALLYEGQHLTVPEYLGLLSSLYCFAGYGSCAYGLCPQA